MTLASHRVNCKLNGRIDKFKDKIKKVFLT